MTKTRNMRTLNRLRLAAALWLLAAGMAGAQTESQAVPSNCVTVLQAFPNQSVTGTLTETNLAAVRIPANSLGPNGMLRITVQWNFTNSANNKLLVLRYATTAGAITGALVQSITQTTNGSAEMIFSIRNSGATGAQTLGGGGFFPYGSAAGSYGTMAIDTTQDTFLNFNGTLANTGETITLLGWTAEILKP
jgi:hypothetical protein